MLLILGTYVLKFKNQKTVIFKILLVIDISGMF